MTTKQHRGVVVGRKGILAASQPLAVSAGLQVLMQGGNFVDAAIAVSSVLCVVEPFASHLGGDAFVVVYDAKARRVVAFNGSGAAPRDATLSCFPDGIPAHGIIAASVPGLVDMWQTLHNQYGTLSLQTLLHKAIGYAGEGFAAGYRYSDRFAASASLLEKFPETKEALLTNGIFPTPGSIVRQPDLAWTLTQIAVGGADAFYTGTISDRIVHYARDHGGLLSKEDFAAHKTQILEPIRTDYRGYTVYGQPPVSQGHILLQMLNLLEGYPLADMGVGSADVIHHQVEAKKLAFADRAAYLGDPSFVSVPMETLLSKEYANQRRNLINPQTAGINVTAGQIDHDTTYFCIADAEGNAISFIQSVFWGFGCGAVAEGTGILFNNRMTGFSLDPDSPNVLEGGKRTAHTLNAYLVTKGDSLAYVGGTPGGDVQVQSNLQVLCNVIDFGMNPQEAVEAPRWQHGGAICAAGETALGVLAIESRVEEAVFDELAEKGHQTERLAPWGHASSYQLIAVHPETATYMAGSDPRCDGHAAGY